MGSPIVAGTPDDMRVKVVGPGAPAVPGGHTWAWVSYDIPTSIAMVNTMDQLGVALIMGRAAFVIEGGAALDVASIIEQFSSAGVELRSESNCPNCITSVSRTGEVVAPCGRWIRAAWSLANRAGFVPRPGTKAAQ